MLQRGSVVTSHVQAYRIVLNKRSLCIDRHLGWVRGFRGTILRVFFKTIFVHFDQISTLEGNVQSEGGGIAFLYTGAFIQHYMVVLS